MSEFILSPRDLSSHTRRRDFILSLVDDGDQVRVEYTDALGGGRYRATGIFRSGPASHPGNLDYKSIVILTDTQEHRGQTQEWYPRAPASAVLVLPTEDIVSIERVVLVPLNPYERAELAHLRTIRKSAGRAQGNHVRPLLDDLDERIAALAAREHV